MAGVCANHSNNALTLDDLAILADTPNACPDLHRYRSPAAARGSRPSVSTSAPLSVTATVCSKCAAFFRSRVTTTQRNVRAVFAGDYGPPVKFSHMRRDEIDYLQSAMGAEVSIETQRSDQLIPWHDMQFVTFLYVVVDGPQVSIEVKTFGEMSSRKFTPEYQRASEQHSYRRAPLIQRVWNVISPRRFVTLALVIGSFLGGVVATWTWSRWKRV